MSDVKRMKNTRTEETGCSPPLTPVPKQESVKQVIKIQNSDENKPKRRNYFTVAHLYLKPASFGRDHSRADGFHLQNGTDK